MAEGTIRGALRTHDREPPSRHCGTGIAPDRDILANWRDLNEPGASLPAVPPGRVRAPRGNCRLFDTGKRNPARDGLFAGGNRIRTIGPAEEDAIRHSFTDAVRAIMKRIASLMQCRRKSEDEALAIVATMVGALTLARAVDDPELSDRILAAARTLLTSR